MLVRTLLSIDAIQAHIQGGESVNTMASIPVSVRAKGYTIAPTSTNAPPTTVIPPKPAASVAADPNNRYANSSIPFCNFVVHCSHLASTLPPIQLRAMPAQQHALNYNGAAPFVYLPAQYAGKQAPAQGQAQPAQPQPVHSCRYNDRRSSSYVSQMLSLSLIPRHTIRRSREAILPMQSMGYVSQPLVFDAHIDR